MIWKMNPVRDIQRMEGANPVWKDIIYLMDIVFNDKINEFL